MKNNLFDFATSELSQDAFICWCLNWHNCGKDAPLYPLAQDLLALMGEPELAENQKIVLKKQFKKIDALVALQGLNKAIIIEDKTYTSEHDEQIKRYNEIIKELPANDKSELGISDDVKIETVYFKTGYHYDYDLETVADYKIDGKDFFKILKKYEGKSEILDDYISHLTWLMEWYNIYGDYTQTPTELSHWEWNIVKHNIAQHNLMKDLLRDRFPISLWKANDEAYKIRIGTNWGGDTSWTELTFVENAYSDSLDRYYLFWRIDTNSKGPYICLRFYEKYDKKNEVKRNRHIEMYNDLRRRAQNFLAAHAELQLDWNDVSGRYSGGYFESTILTICLKEVLTNWDENKEILKKQVLAITDFFA